MKFFLVITALGLLNFIVSHRFKDIDLTPNEINSLTKETNKALSEIKVPIEVTIVARGNNQLRIRKLVELFQSINSKIKIKQVDPERDILFINQHKINKLPVVLFQQGEKKKFVSTHDELNYINALAYVASSSKKTLHFTVGHQESSFEDKTPLGISHIKQKLINSQYELKPLDLLSNINDQIKNIIVFGPKGDFSKEEINKLTQLIKNGANFLFFGDPIQEGQWPNLINFLKSKGVSYGPGFIVNKNNFIDGSNGLAPIFLTFYDPTERAELSGRFFFPFVSPVIYEGDNKVNYLTETKVGESLVGTNFLRANEYINTPPSKNTFSPAVAIELEKSKFVVFGNSSFLQNRFEQFSDLSNILFSQLEWMGNFQYFRSLNVVGPKVIKVEKTMFSNWMLIYVLLGVPLFVGSLQVIFAKRWRKSFV